MDLTEIFTNAVHLLQDPTYQQGAMFCALPLVASVAAIGIHIHDQAAGTVAQQKTRVQGKSAASRPDA